MLKKSLLLTVGLSFVIFLGNILTLYSEEKKVRTKIGMQVISDSKYRIAKSRERVNSGDLISRITALFFDKV